MSRYRHAYLQAMVSCADCGAVVQDQEVHDRWHESVLSKAHLIDVLQRVAHPSDPYEAQADAARAEWLAERDES